MPYKKLTIHKSESYAFVYFFPICVFSTPVNFRNRCFIQRVFGWSLSCYALIAIFPTALERSKKLPVTEQRQTSGRELPASLHTVGGQKRCENIGPADGFEIINGGDIV